MGKGNKRKKIEFARAKKASALAIYKTIILSRKNIGLLVPWNKKMIEEALGKGISYEEGKKKLRRLEIDREKFARIFCLSSQYEKLAEHDLI